MHNLDPSEYGLEAKNVQPWLGMTVEDEAAQQKIRDVLAANAGANFGRNTFVASDAFVFTNKLNLGDRSWIATGAIIRGHIEIGPDCSINPYAHLAGRVTLGRGCRIAGSAAIYGFNHGFSRLDIFIKDQPITSVGVTLGDDVWIGAHAIILDGVEIGSHSVVAAGAVVTRSFPDYQIIAGNPARAISDRRQLDALKQDAAPSKTKGAVRAIIHTENPYSGFEGVLEEDLQPEGGYDASFSEIIIERRPGLIVEVGSCKGRNAIHMADICSKIALHAEIICVDTWLGNWRQWAKRDGPGSRAELNLKNGASRLYWQFLSNVRRRSYEDVITPLPLSASSAAKLFDHHGIYVDLVYLVGEPDYEVGLLDLKGWLGQLSPDGQLFGHNLNAPGVKRAVDEISKDGRYVLEYRDNMYSITRKR